MTFQRSTDAWGKLYSIIPQIATLFPEQSGFKTARDASLQLHTFFKVIVANYSLISWILKKEFDFYLNAGIN